MNIKQKKEQWTKFIKQKYPDKFYENSSQQTKNYSLEDKLETLKNRLEKLEKKIQEENTARLNIMTRLLKLELSRR